MTGDEDLLNEDEFQEYLKQPAWRIQGQIVTEPEQAKAAIEQLQTWGERNQIPVISQHLGADSASVIYDAIDDTTLALEGLLTPDIVEESIGNAEVRDLFKLPKIGIIAGVLTENRIYIEIKE